MAVKQGALQKFLEQKLVTLQHAMERKMLHNTPHDKVENSIRSKTKVKDILEKTIGGKMEMGRAHSITDGQSV